MGIDTKTGTKGKRVSHFYRPAYTANPDCPHCIQIEILQGGLRKKIVDMVKASAAGDFEKAIVLTREYLEQLGKEQQNAEEAIQIVQNIMSGSSKRNPLSMKRKEVSEYLGISMDTLRK